MSMTNTQVLAFSKQNCKERGIVNWKTRKIVEKQLDAFDAVSRINVMWWYFGQNAGPIQISCLKRNRLLLSRSSMDTLSSRTIL